jgi:hypothetical protein
MQSSTCDPSLFGQVGVSLAYTIEQLKCWSQNLGHSNIETTVLVYGEIPDWRREDIMREIIGEQMAKTLGQPIVLENVAGAGGATGTARAAQSKPDGYTIMIGHMGTHGAAPAINPNLKYDPAKDFAPIGMIAGTAIVIIAKKDFPARKSEGICRVRAKEPDQAYRSARRHRLGGPHHLCLAAIDHGHQYSTRCLPRHGPVHGRPCCRAGRLWSVMAHKRHAANCPLDHIRISGRGCDPTIYHRIGRIGNGSPPPRGGPFFSCQ